MEVGEGGLDEYIHVDVCTCTWVGIEWVHVGD